MFLSSHHLQSSLLTFYFLLHLPLIVDAISTSSHALSASVPNTTESTATSLRVISSVKSETSSILPATFPDNLTTAASITSGSATSVSSGAVVVISSSVPGIVSSMSTPKPVPSEPPVISSTSTVAVSRVGHNAPAPPQTQVLQNSSMPSSSSAFVSSTTRGKTLSSTTHPASSIPVSDSTRGNVISTPTPSASNTNVPAPPPPPKSSSSAPPPQIPRSSSHTGSVVTSVTVVQASQPTRTMTVTASATTTFSTPVVSTSTAFNGAKIVTTPPLVTVLSTSTEPNGALTTITQVVANPPALTSSEQLSKNNNDLSHKPGLLAGICVIGGLVAALIIIGSIFCLRRNRRIARRRRWLAGMQQQRPTSLTGDPFRDPVPMPKEGYSDQAGPVMQIVDLNRDDDRWEQRNGGGGSSTLLSPAQGSPRPYEPRNLFALYPDPHPQMQPVHFTGSPSENHELENVGIAYSTNLAVPLAQFKRHSFTPSSPSIYPASLPPDDQDDFHGQESRSLENSVPVLKPEIPARSPARLSAVIVPPRPPRSYLRESAKIQVPEAYKPLTPPASESSSKPPSPISEPRPQDVLTRRTLLDVRSRSISQGV